MLLSEDVERLNEGTNRERMSERMSERTIKGEDKCIKECTDGTPRTQ